MLPSGKRYQLIFMVETQSEKNDSDFLYIQRVLDDIYGARRLGHKITPLYMKSKSNYDKMSKSLELKKKKYKGDESIVFLCFDIDEESNDAYKYNADIFNYCEKNELIPIWFKYEIENAFLGKTVSRSLKTKEANAYFAKGNAKNLVKKLSYPNNDYDAASNGSSNILTVLDHFFDRIS